jgi:CRISPR-associated protein Csx3
MCTDEVTVSVSDKADYSKVSLDIKTKHLDYLQAPEIALPEVPAHKGIVLDGAMPSWLMTALVRLYVGEEVPWVACYQPQLRGAVVVATCGEWRKIGEVISL